MSEHDTYTEEPVAADPAGELDEEELRRAYEAELQRITVAEVVLQTAVSLVNMGGMRLGLGGGQAAANRDLDQARDAIDAVRALMPVLERHGGQHVRAVRDALSQLQFAYSREASASEPGEPAPTAPEVTRTISLFERR